MRYVLNAFKTGGRHATLLLFRAILENSQQPTVDFMVFAALGVVPSALLYLYLEASGRRRWRRCIDGDQPAGPSAPFRDGGRVPTFFRAAPKRIRLAAYSCLLAGGLLLLGLLAAPEVSKLGNTQCIFFDAPVILSMATSIFLVPVGVMLLGHDKDALVFAGPMAQLSMWFHACLAVFLTVAALLDVHQLLLEDYRCKYHRAAMAWNAGAGVLLWAQAWYLARVVSAERSALTAAGQRQEGLA